NTYAAAIHLVFEPDDGRTAVVPSQPGVRSAAAHDLVGEERVEVLDGIDLGRGGSGPGKAQRREASFHDAENEASLLAQAGRRDVAAAHDEVVVVELAFRCFAAACYDEAAAITRVRLGIGKRVERRLRGRIQSGADVAARDRVHFSVVDAPVLQLRSVDLVE